MISITKKESEYIRSIGMGKFVKLSSATHKSGSKRYWLVENPRALNALSDWREKSTIKTGE